MRLIRDAIYLASFGISIGFLLNNLAFTLALIKYIDGTTINVKKVAKLKPKIIVQDNGPQKATLSPPK
jgi:hypothetical protein